MKKEVKKVFQDCKMIAVVQNNASNSEDMLTLRHRLHKHSLTVKFFPNQVETFPRLKVHCCIWLLGEKHPYGRGQAGQPIPPAAYNKALF